MAFFSSHRAKTWFFTIYMGKPVGSRFGQIVRTIQDRQISSWNRVYHFYNYKSIPIIEKRPRKLKLVSKMALKKWNTNSVPFEAFLWQIYQMKQRKNSCSIYSFQPDLPNIFCKFWTTRISDSSSVNWHGEEKNELTVHWQWRLSPL